MRCARSHQRPSPLFPSAASSALTEQPIELRRRSVELLCRSRTPQKIMLMHLGKNGHLRLADRPADYERLGIAPVEIAEFEDGQRIGTERGCYEWWYFDAHLDDSATVV